MHPTLFEIPLPAWPVPLRPTLAVLAVLLGLVAAMGYRSRARDLLIVGALGALGSALGAWRLSGDTLALGPVAVHGYGGLLAVALALGWMTTLSVAARDGWSRDALAQACVVAVVAGIAGARLLYVVETSSDSFMEVLAVRRGGLALHGGLVAAALAALVVLDRRRLPWLAWADAAAPAFGLGVMWGGAGCYLAGSDFGRPLGDWAPAWLRRLGTFPRWQSEMLGSGSPPWLAHVQRHALPPEASASLPVHPTQLYEVAVGVALVASWLATRRFQRFRGQPFIVVAVIFETTRLGLGPLRDETERAALGPALPVGVWLALGLLALGGAVAAGAGPSLPARRRWALRAAVLSPGLLAVALAWLGGPTRLMRVSVDGWIALSVVVLAGAAWRLLDGRARRL